MDTHLQPVMDAETEQATPFFENRRLRMIEENIRALTLQKTYFELCFADVP
jgi:hypothetical protein